MSLIKCVACEHKISKKAKASPSCGQPNKKANHLSGAESIAALTFGVVALVGLVVVIDSGLGGLSGLWLDDIEDQVARDAVQEYDIANKHGSPIDACVHAGFVSAAYLQANDSENYQAWKVIESGQCALAGLR